MNVKPGDLAMVVRNTMGVSCFESQIGTPIRVDERLVTPFGAMDAWTYRGPRLHCPRCGTLVIAFLDADLQPIRGIPAGTSVTTEQPVEAMA